MQQDQFLTYWLLLPLIGIVLFGVSEWGRNGRSEEEQGGWFSVLRRFALRFSMVYWVLYLIPAPLNMMIHGKWNVIDQYSGEWTDSAVQWIATNLIGMEGELAVSRASGDTTGNYIRVLAIFVTAIVSAAIWTAVVRKPNKAVASDLLRTYLRYSLAFVLIVYGLAKLFPFTNQFPDPSLSRLMQPYGDSSPMGILWTFMGASRPYTYFAGAMEVVAAVLLFSRKTSMLGALFSAGVMLNVASLNFFYDVPVKLYSSHLLLMAVFLVLADADRLIAFFVSSKESRPASLSSPFFDRYSSSLKSAAKAIVILLGFIVPTYRSYDQNHFAAEVSASEPDWFGTFEVVEHQVDGVSVTSQESRWSRLTVSRLPYSYSIEDGLEWKANDIYSIQLGDETVLRGVSTLSEDGLLLQLENSAPDELTVEAFDGRYLSLSAYIDGKELTLHLKKLRREDYLLVNRGYHWINEFPYNR